MIKSVAAIDIGTNSVLLTIAEAGLNSGVKARLELANITRLGEGVADSGLFNREAMKRTLAVLTEYARVCKEYSVTDILVVGTAAMRRARNSGEFIKRVQDECGLTIEVISGEREAELSFLAASTDFGSNIIVVDIGGGSTEFISGATVSIPIGSVLLHEKIVKTDPISDKEFSDIVYEVQEKLKKISPPPDLPPQGGRENLNAPILRQAQDERSILVATAGTATTLAAMKLGLKEYSHSKVHGEALTIADIEKIIDDLKGLTIEDRKKLPGLEPKRADVILPGALILETVMKKLGYDKVTVSDRGVRWGLIYEQVQDVSALEK